MTFLSVVIVLLVVQWWGSGRPLHKDRWFLSLWQRLDGLKKLPVALRLGLTLALPVLGLSLLWGALHQISAGFLLILCVNCLVLLYSLGRGDFSQPLQAYTEAAHADQSVRAVQIVDESNLDPALRAEPHPDDWLDLNHEALRVFAYRGFERMFAVLFWFLLLGAPAALAYRLLILLWQQLLQSNHPGAQGLGKVITWVEWPAACLMGLSWALVGNFDACVAHWRHGCLHPFETTPVYLARVLRGALGDNDAAEPGSTQAVKIEPAFSLQMIEQMPGMFSRSLLLWVVVAAVITLIF
ncbi:regulatory signaling modulator protein AmpE [Gilvimarinus xylanilyticus]|uniref:Regulatory signaling modulator protein AmpE n=1 Tax=Gilvimarinus xylanilyticus TaxID=2944139 RepID=A0A9X2KUF8_9GAMM|nr:regulatory signaling modulator protein AmpE [Gilvimarinus xylanilyticus]MCP8900207.1 regulatory signaling modulator protein AmpE [Gilvimarinus xylanilyticus]